MAKLILLLVFVCFQFSRQEELTDIKPPSDDLIDQEISFPEGMLDGEDRNQWLREKDEGNWTEEDEKWFQQIQEALKDSEEDYDYNSEEIEKLIDEIDKWVGESYPGKGKYQWLSEVEKWLEDFSNDDDDYADYPDLKKKENLNNEDNMNLYYSWLYRKKMGNSKTRRAKPFKRFWSV